MRIFRRLLGDQPQSPGTAAYESAMRKSDDLIEKMEHASRSKDVVPAMMADIWLQRHNVPFITTVFESVREMKAATTDQKPEGGQDGETS